MYAILDIEGTGGKRGEEAIMEIAIIRFDGTKVVDQFSCLVQPDRAVDAYVQKMTQITPKMLIRAPKFFEIAKRVVEITENATLVAHGVSYDYRMIRQEFARLGFEYEREVIDTVPWAQRLMPDLNGYSLSSLSKAIGIPFYNKHRALNDAQANLEIFKLLLTKDSSKSLLKNTVEGYLISDKHRKILDQLPNACGVYYLKNEMEKIIYVGKSIQINQRIRQHLMGKSGKSQKIRNQLKTVDFQLTGTELIALLQESEDIKNIRPKINRAQKRELFPFGIFLHAEKGDYKQLIIQKIKHPKETPLMVFSSYEEAEKQLFRWTEEYVLCQKINGLYGGNNSCFGYQVEQCKGACVKKELPKSYNGRVNQLLKYLELPKKHLLIIDKGREKGEESFIYLKNGVLQGYGYFNYQYQIESEEKIHQRMITLTPSRYNKQILRRFLFKKRYAKMVELSL